jgi:hypothetical protein
MLKRHLLDSRSILKSFLRNFTSVENTLNNDKTEVEPLIQTGHEKKLHIPVMLNEILEHLAKNKENIEVINQSH